MSPDSSLRFLVVAAAAAALTSNASAQSADSTRKLEVEGYAIVNYHTFDWQTDPARRALMDIERAAIEASYELDRHVIVEAEVEFEHGGTGATMEFDKFEEFGEYEQEVEQGGEVVLEKLAVTVPVAPELNIRIGHFYVPVGLTNSDYEPMDYFTVVRSESETSLIPATWHETGLELFGRHAGLRYRLLVVNGLDATGFSSAGWVAPGKQGRFEGVSAETLAVAARLDYSLAEGIGVGASGYFGNSADNRPKPDLTVPANVTIGEFHTVIETGGATVRGQILYGALQNSGAVSKANRGVSNNLNVKRTPVAAAALGTFVEAGYDILPLFADVKNDAMGLEIYGRFDYYDSMFRVDEGIFDNPRWERRTVSAGLNFRYGRNLIIKSQFSNRTLGTSVDNRENTFSLGTGVEF